MIEATCGACGTVARIAEADVPTGAKFVTCAMCKSRVPLPQQKAAAGKPPAVPGGKAPPPTPSSKPTVDLADLPAPKRASPLGDAGPSKPAPARSSPLDGADLPAPKSAGKPAAASLDLDDLMPADLPAPKAKGGAGVSDLPAPKPRASALGDAPASKPAPSALADLPAPKAKPSALADLPAPKAKPAALDDLPMPKKPAAADALGDLPAPKKGGNLDLADLPAPKRGSDPGDLPAPKRPSNGSLDLDDNMLTPKPGANSDLPAPKGFFDDLPQPAMSNANAKSVDLPAPKGFFDDLPQPAKGGGKGGIDLPAPKGFFDDLPQPAAKPAAEAKGGFFDDLPQPAKPAGKASGFDDLAKPNAKPSAISGGPDDIALDGPDLGVGGLGGGAPQPFELDTGGGPGPELDLGLPLASTPSAGDFTDLDLSEPTSGKKGAAAAPAEADSPIKIKTPKGGAPKAPIPITVKKDEKGEVKFDLADDPHEGKPGAAAATAGKTPAKRPAGAKEEEAPEVAAKKQKRKKIILGAALGLVLAGSGGAYFYKKHAAEQARQDEIATHLATARKQLADGDPKHWQRATAAAQSVLDLAPNHSAALGLAAEAALAGALDNGINFDARVKQGRKLTQDGLGTGKIGPEIERAQALMTLAANQPDNALKMMQKLIAKSPKDGWLQLYLGWTQLAKGDADEAIKAFSQAVALSPATKLPAQYGNGRAKLLKADIEGARASFAAVLAADAKHVGAQVGLAATLPPQQSAQREADLRAILSIPEAELKSADPRAITQAWNLLGDLARSSGRLDIARESYRKALAIPGSATDLAALTGLAAVEMRDNKLQVAADIMQKAVTANPNDALVQLLSAELDIAQGKLPDAEGKITKLAERQPPLPTLQMTRLHVVRGKLREAQGKFDEAVTEYQAGAKLAGELDLTPTMAAVRLLNELAKKAPDPAKADQYKNDAIAMLAQLAARAQEDGELSMTLGVAYLQSGNAAKAEELLQRAATMREKDPESRLQLGKAYAAQGKTDQAIAILKEALAIDAKRLDVALELAQTYQRAGRDAEAMATYDQLLTDPAAPIIVRVNAGRYFALKGALEKAAAQAEPILKAEPENAGGLYLKGEGLMLAKKWDEARVTLVRANDIDQADAQYLDALGRAFEGSLVASEDTKYIESARHAYERATKADPAMFHPHLGLGKMLVMASKYDEAIKPLSAAIAIDKGSAEVMYWMGLAFYGVRNQSPAHKKTAADWLETALKNGAATLPIDLRAEASYKLGQLYIDLNKAQQAAAALQNATQLGENIEQNTGKTPTAFELTETYYYLGDLYYKLGNPVAQKKAWQRFVDRKPKPSERKTTAEQALLTSLQRY